MDAKPSRSSPGHVDQERLESIINASPTIAFIWDLSEGWPVAYVSKGIESLGYTVEEFLSREIVFEHIVHPDDLERVSQEVEQAIDSGAVDLEQQYRVMTRSGEVRWVKDWTKFKRDGTGIAVQAQGVILDITDFVNAEERAKDFSRFTLENPNPILRVDCFGDILLTNKPAQKIISDLSMASQAQQQEWRKMLALAADMQLSGRFELQVGSRIYEFRIQHVEGREYTNLYGDDVTEERQNLVRITDIAANLPAALFQYTLKAESPDEILFLNDKAADIWGIKCGEIGNGPQHMWDMAHPDDLDALRASVEQSALSGKNWDHEWRIVMPSGDVKWLRGLGSPHEVEDSIGVWNTLVFDITAEKKSAEALSDALKQAVRVLSAALEARDPYTAGHEQRVAEISLQIGRAMGLDSGRLTGLELAATIHDVGKIKIPAEILSKPTRLTAEEFALIKAHPVVGASLISGIEFDWPIADIIRQHHERFDGSGYPDGLSGRCILLEARIIAVADTLEAMASHRPYRPGLGLDKASEEIRIGAGTRYDPDVAKCCLALVEKGSIQL